MTNTAKTRRFIVLQSGARHGYAVPAFLAQAGALEKFYTDYCSHPALDRLFSAWPRRWTPKTVRRLAGRRLPPDIPRQRVHQMPARRLLGWMLRRDPDSQLDRTVLRHGFGRANALYTNSLYLDSAAVDLLAAARQRGIFVAYEQLGYPEDVRIIREENRRFPGIESDIWGEDEEFDPSWERAIWGAADRILAPSGLVQSSLIALGAPRERIAMVPYGIPSTWLELEPTPKPGRVLFVGQAGLRKGTHYLAAAARLLRSRGIGCEVRIVGPVARRLLNSPLFSGPTYAGPVPRVEVFREFLSADIFVLPTLSDSFAVAHLEALACGVPVITTPNCGSVVRDGMEGFIVPIRDERALADKIELLLGDRALRERMSFNARARARHFTWEDYKPRLLAALGVSNGDTAASPDPAEVTRQSWRQ